jgi:hypothetical protein
MAHVSASLQEGSSSCRAALHTPSPREVAPHVVAVMSPEIAELIDGLHADLSADELSALWSRCRASLA